MLCATKGECSNRLSPPLANLAPLPTSPGQHLPPASRKSFEIVSLKDQHVPTPGRASNTRLKSPPGARHPQLCTQSLPQPSTAELFCFLCWFSSHGSLQKSLPPSPVCPAQGTATSKAVFASTHGSSITHPWQGLPGLPAVLWGWCRGECCQKHPLFELLVNTACRTASVSLNRHLRSPAVACLQWGQTGTGGWGCLGSCSNSENIHLRLCGLRADDSLSRRKKSNPPLEGVSRLSQPTQQAPVLQESGQTAQETLFGFSAKAYF